MISVTNRTIYDTTVNILDWMTRYLLDHQWRVNVSSAGVGFAAGLFLLAGSQFDGLFFAGICLILLSFTVGSRRFGPKLMAAGIAVMVGSAIFSVAGSVIWGPGQWIISAIIANWVMIFAVLPFMRLDPGKLLLGLMPSLLITAVIIIFQGVTGQPGRMKGVFDSPNPVAGILVIGALMLLPTRFRWLAIPMTVAIPFTGSRLALLTLVISVGIMLIARVAPLKSTVAIGIISIGVLLPFLDVIGNNTRVFTPGIAATASSPATDRRYTNVEAKAAHDLNVRLTVLERPGIVPKGFVYDPLRPVHEHYNGPPHNVALRIGIEWGYTALIAWAALTIWALVYGYRNSAPWHILMAVIFLGSLDYYVHVGPLAWAWWLAIGLMFNSRPRFKMATVHLPDGSPIRVLSVQ